MQITIGKIVALLIALGYVIAMIVHAVGVTVDVAKGCVALLLPLALIWFPDELGGVTVSEPVWKVANDFSLTIFWLL